MVSLHDQVMNIPCDQSQVVRPGGAVQPYLLGHREGHKDARHTAAELARPFDAFVDEMRDVAKGEIGGAFVTAALKRLDGETP